MIYRVLFASCIAIFVICLMFFGMSFLAITFKEYAGTFTFLQWFLFCTSIILSFAVIVDFYNAAEVTKGTDFIEISPDTIHLRRKRDKNKTYHFIRADKVYPRDDYIIVVECTDEKTISYVQRREKVNLDFGINIPKASE